ncbi:MAG TPA: response regulator, partial [Planctomycetota bacterium]|nr:response regulator [Planctomycetota bacterium]
KTCKPCALKVVRDLEETKRFLDGPGAADRPSLVIAELGDPQAPPAAALLRWLRTNERTKHLPILVLAESEDQTSVRLAYDLGASSYLVKPQDEKELGRLADTAVNYWIRLNHPAG